MARTGGWSGMIGTVITALTSCTFIGNLAFYAQGVGAFDCTLNNCILTQNSAPKAKISGGGGEAHSLGKNYAGRSIPSHHDGRAVALGRPMSHPLGCTSRACYWLLEVAPIRMRLRELKIYQNNWHKPCRKIGCRDRSHRWKSKGAKATEWLA